MNVAVDTVARTDLHDQWKYSLLTQFKEVKRKNELVKVETMVFTVMGCYERKVAKVGKG